MFICSLFFSLTCYGSFLCTLYRVLRLRGQIKKNESPWNPTPRPSAWLWTKRIIMTVVAIHFPRRHFAYAKLDCSIWMHIGTNFRTLVLKTSSMGVGPTPIFWKPTTYCFNIFLQYFYHGVLYCFCILWPLPVCCISRGVDPPHFMYFLSFLFIYMKITPKMLFHFLFCLVAVFLT